MERYSKICRVIIGKAQIVAASQQVSNSFAHPSHFISVKFIYELHWYPILLSHKICQCDLLCNNYSRIVTPRLVFFLFPPALSIHLNIYLLLFYVFCAEQ